MNKAAIRVDSGQCKKALVGRWEERSRFLRAVSTHDDHMGSVNRYIPVQEAVELK